MDRVIYYAGAQGRSVDVARQSRAAMIGVAKTFEALYGTATAVDGLACVPTGPASLQVVVGAGQIYSLQNIDGTAFGPLAADTAHQIMKQGLLLDAVTLNCPAPGTAGQSINYLIQATFQEVDAGSVVLPYYNSANPAVPYSGPANAGTPNFTQRNDVCVVAVKAGTAATTGTQTTPAADAGYVGLYAVTVANGQTAINAGGIAVLGSAPFIAGKIGSVTPYALIVDQKASGTLGGTATAGAWRTRDLNTEAADTANIVSLASNQFTLQPGRYRLKASAPVLNTASATARIQNITDGATVAVGTSINGTSTGTADGVQVRSEVTAEFTITSAKTFELQQYPNQTSASDGFGTAAAIASTPEIYSQVEIWKVA